MSNSRFGQFRQAIHDFRDHSRGVEFDAGGGPDLVLGSRFADRLLGGRGPDALFGNRGDDDLRGGRGIDTAAGGRGNDSFVFAPGDMALTRGFGNGHLGLVDTVLDFHGAGTNGSGQQDVIRLEGFGAGTTLQFAGHAFGQRDLQYYKVMDPTTRGPDGVILIRMADGTNRLTPEDVEIVPRNAPPAFAADAFEFAIDESNAPGAAVGSAPASDPDGDALTYAILENEDASRDNDVPFAVDASGNITATAPLDHEREASHSFTLGVTDAAGLTDTAAVTVRVGDVTVPAALDFVVGGGLSGSAIHFGDGQGGEDRMAELGAVIYSPVLGDMDGDGDLDIVAIGGGIELRLNDGSGDFGDPVPVAAGDFTSLTLGDLNGDGALDMVARGIGTVTAILSDGQGGFVPGADMALAGSGAALLGDLDGDGNLDLVSADRDGGAVQVRLGDGQGGFIAAPSLASDSPGALALGDLDGDGSLDLVVGSETSVSVHLGTGDGGFAATGTAVDTRGSDVALGDVNGDGALDLVTSHDGAGGADAAPTVSVRLGDGQGGFDGGEDYEVYGFPMATGPLALADLDGDGDLDIAAVFYTGRLSTEVYSLLGEGDGSFGPGGGFGSVPFPAGLAIGELDGPAELTNSGLPDLGPLVPATNELDWA
ncbi:VCBS repeat-containing protein [Paracoccus sp. Z118]|uniref:FG-GAP-like repeat-containing protein n=1 Tax=Paracoccus sp. Z118 TaxID=2851017 RepID=UPI001C2BFE29|nr:FG-GAP-like repeat-containing protein [Paracoccus sp. Z118]MBV0892972.1 VCBS repeat-containing protein [Paracoccus sp. Z118]